MKIILSVISFLMITPFLFCQEKNIIKDDFQKNEIGIDVANILTFLSKKNESYLVNYKRHLSINHTIRAGLNLDWSTEKDQNKSIGTRVGYEYDCPLKDNMWKLHSGVDFSFYYYGSNYQPNTQTRYGLTPLIGFSYYPVRRFSISTEVGLNIFYTQFRNPDSFDADANINSFDFNIGSVGMLVLYYHF